MSGFAQLCIFTDLCGSPNLGQVLLKGDNISLIQQINN